MKRKRVKMRVMRIWMVLMTVKLLLRPVARMPPMAKSRTARNQMQTIRRMSWCIDCADSRVAGDSVVSALVDGFVEGLSTCDSNDPTPTPTTTVSSEEGDGSPTKFLVLSIRRDSVVNRTEAKWTLSIGAEVKKANITKALD
jgi:hypothetical protein